MIVKKRILLLPFVLLLSVVSFKILHAEADTTAGENSISFAPNAIGIPIGKILSIRKLNEY